MFRTILRFISDVVMEEIVLRKVVVIYQRIIKGIFIYRDIMYAIVKGSYCRPC